MHWNHRVVKVVEFDEPILMIQEVYYNEKGQPCGYCEPCFVGDDLEELKTQVNRWAECLNHPILEANKDFNNSFEEDEEGGSEYE